MRQTLGCTAAAMVVWAIPPPAEAGLLEDLAREPQEAASEIAAGDVLKGMPGVSAPGDGDRTPSDGPAMAAENGWPTVAARELLVVGLRPDVLDDDDRLKRIAGNVDPDRRRWMNTDPVRWRRERDAIRAELVEQASSVPTSYEITPWPGRAVMASLGAYDMGRQAFAMRVRTGASGAWPWRGDHRLQWLPAPPDLAERMVAAFGDRERFVYAGYTLRVAGVTPKGSGHRTYAFFDDRIDHIDVYTFEGSGLPTTPDDFVHRVRLDTHTLRTMDHAGRGRR